MIERYKDIEYKLTRSKRKTASLHIERDGQVSLIVPESVSVGEIQTLIEKKRKWIYKNLAEWQELNSTRIDREFVGGEGFLYLGRTYRLKWVGEQVEPLTLRNGYFCMLKSSNGNLNPTKIFKEFYRQKGLEKIGERVRHFGPKMGVTVKQVRVLELKQRWASCTSAGTLNFHWKCMMAPLVVLDYIVVHELAHLLHANHTNAYWNEVDKILPDYRERQLWLRQNGAGMSL